MASDNAQGRARGRPKKMDRDDMLDLAVETYWEEGPRGVSINAFCQEANISKPSLYREFDSEDGLMAAALARYAENVLAALGGILTEPAHFRARLQTLIDFITENPQFEVGCMAVKMHQHRDNLGARTQETLGAIEAAGLQSYRQFFDDARAKGEWSSELTPEFAAEYLNAQVGLALTQRAEGVPAEKVKAMLETALSVL